MQEKEIGRIVYLDNLLKDNGVTLSRVSLDKLVLFYDELVEKNKVMNLTAITDFDQVCVNHFLDSLSFIRLFKDEDPKKLSSSIIDVGTGAGFPGIVLAIAFPQLSVTLLDSLNKRVAFLDEVSKKLEIENVSAVHARAEDAAFMPQYREGFDIAVSRAVANLSTLCEYCLPFVKTGGMFIAYKSEKIKEEAPLAGKAVKILGGEFEKQEEFYLPPVKNDMPESYRNLYVIKKKGDTPKKYPRKAGVPSKNPL